MVEKFYHVTYAPVAERIRKEGFHPSDRFNAAGVGVYLWNDRLWAENYVWDGWAHPFDPRTDGDLPAIVEIEPSKADLAKIVPFKGPEDPWHFVASVYPTDACCWKPRRRVIDASYVLDFPTRPIPEAP
jgi:hypothetical protein